MTLPLRVENLSKTYNPGTPPAVDDLSIELHDGETVALLGPSGCGKTTTLRCVAGLESPDSGTITVADQTVFSSAGKRPQSMPPEKRKLAMVFQQYALWPHMDVYQNVAFALKSVKWERTAIAGEVEQALRRVKLWEQRHKRVSQISGGQQQRVALARAIVGNPSLILFDEPLSNLDARLRESVRLELLELQQSMGFASLYVTHDQEEALSLANRVIIMNAGHIEQTGRPTDIWQRPATAFVAEFIGSTNKLTGTVRNRPDGAALVLPDGTELTLPRRYDFEDRESIEAFIKIGALAVSTERPLTTGNVIESSVRLKSFNGDFDVLKVMLGDQEILARRSRWETPVEVLDKIYLQVAPEDITCYRATDTTPIEADLRTEVSQSAKIRLPL